MLLLLLFFSFLSFVSELTNVLCVAPRNVNISWFKLHTEWTDGRMNDYDFSPCPCCSPLNRYYVGFTIICAHHAMVIALVRRCCDLLS